MFLNEIARIGDILHILQVKDGFLIIQVVVVETLKKNRKKYVPK